MKLPWVRYSIDMFLLLLFHVLPIYVAAEARKDAAITMGAILPLTGPAAAVGNAVRNGMEIGLDALPSEIRPRLSIKFEDDANNPRNTVLAFKKFDPVVDVVITITAQPSMAVAPLADTHKLPMIAIAVPPAIVEGRSWVVLFFATPEAMAEAAVAEATRRGYRRIARISSIHDGREAQGRAFDRACRKSGLELVYDEEYLLGERDFRTAIAKLRSLREIDAIYLNLFIGQLGLFAKQARAGGLTQPFFTTDAFIEDSGEQEAAEGTLLNQWYVSQAEPSLAFKNEYKKRFPNQSMVAAENGHDIIVLLAEALRQNIVSRHDINHFLHAAKEVEGVLGRFSARDDNRFNLPVDVKAVTRLGIKIMGDKRGSLMERMIESQ